MMGGCPFGGMDQRLNLGFERKGKKSEKPSDTHGQCCRLRLEVLPREDPITRGRFTMCVKQRKLEPTVECSHFGLSDGGSRAAA